MPIRAFESEVLTALRSALVDVGLDVEEDEREPLLGLAGRTWQPDAVLTVNGQEVAVEAKAAVTEREADQLISYAHALSLPMLVASRRIADGARERLRGENVGSFDGRGRLRLSLPGVLVDTDVASRQPERTSATRPSRSGGLGAHRHARGESVGHAGRREPWLSTGLPTIIALQRAAAQFGRSERSEERACTVAVAPVPLVCHWPEDRPGEHWKVANHVVVALDIANDESRVREILERWSPPEGITRVW